VKGTEEEKKGRRKRKRDGGREKGW
jgi:hypothetical protein